MTADWEFEHSIVTKAGRSDAWTFWADMRNHADMEPGVERIELDGPFETGTKGRTISAGSQQEWELSEVVRERRFVITGTAPGLTLSFAWDFEDAGTGTRMTQRISAAGPLTGDYLDEFRRMEVRAPPLMAELAERLDLLAASREN